jgi:hypothetical protein
MAEESTERFAIHFSSSVSLCCILMANINSSKVKGKGKVILVPFN